MMKKRTISIFIAILLSFALMFIIPAPAEKTFTATFDGDIQGTMTVTLKKGYWWGTEATLTFVDPLSDPDFWIGLDGITDFAGDHSSVSVQTQKPQGETTLNIRLGGGTAGDDVLIVGAIIDFSLSPGNVVITSVPPPSGQTWYIHHNVPHVWEGNPSFNITISLAPG